MIRSQLLPIVAGNVGFAKLANEMTEMCEEVRRVTAALEALTRLKRLAEERRVQAVPTVRREAEASSLAL